MFSEKHPQAARKFDISLRGYEAWESACADHNWLKPSDRLYSDADGLLSFVAFWYNPGDVFVNARFWNTFGNLRQEYAKMARRKLRETEEKKAAWLGFLDKRLTEQELDELDEWQPSPAEIWESVDKLILDGYRVTLSYNPKFKTATATIIDEKAGRKAGGWSLASSDANGALALKAAVFKHFIVLEGSWDVLLDLPLTPGKRG